MRIGSGLFGIGEDILEVEQFGLFLFFFGGISRLKQVFFEVQQSVVEIVLLLYRGWGTRGDELLLLLIIRTGVGRAVVFINYLRFHIGIRGIYLIAQLLIRLEDHFVVGRNGDLLAGLGVVALALLDRPKLELSEACNIDLGVFFQSFVDDGDQAFDKVMGKLLGVVGLL